MKKIFMILSLLASFCFSQEAEKLITVKASDLPIDLVKRLEEKEKVEKYGGYVGLGKEIGEAVKGSLSALTDETDKFAKTGVGKFTMFIVAWKVIGLGVIRLMFGIPLFFIGTVIFIWSFWKNCIPGSILDEVDKEGNKSYKAINLDYRGEFLWGHAICYALFILICSAITIIGF